MNPIELEALSPVERMELADALYDSALQEIEATEPLLSPDQRAELDRRLERLTAGHTTLVPWDQAFDRLMLGR